MVRPLKRPIIDGPPHPKCGGTRYYQHSRGHKICVECKRQDNRRTKMADRTFETATREFGDKRLPVALVRCECGTEGTFRSSSFNGHLPNDVIARKFEENGWRIGRKSTQDKCPTCTEKKATPMKKQCEAVTAPVIVAEAPPKMDRASRRIIFAKLEEIYISETIGYAPGWNDDKVAADLGCARAWVAEIREQNFGPAMPDGQRQRLLDAATALRGQGDDLNSCIKKLQDDMQDLVKKVALFDTDRMSLLRQFEGLVK